MITWEKIFLYILRASGQSISLPPAGFEVKIKFINKLNSKKNDYIET